MVRTQRSERPRSVIRLVCAGTALTLLALGLRGHSSTREAAPPVNFMGSKQRSGIKRSLHAGFPGARDGYDVADTVLAAVKPLGLKNHNTIFGTSICSDEINSDRGHVTTILKGLYGRSFHLGGIGGAPYVGKTGFMAFSHHVPADGHVLIVFGPHIGFSPDGEPGKFLRTGQAKLSTSCGAVIAAYSQCTSGQNMPADPQDIMQSWLRQKLASYCPAVAKSDNPMVDLVLKAYKEIEAEMLAIVNTDFGSGNLVLLGGIQINMPYPMPGYFEPLHFSVRSKDKEPVDLMSAFR